MSEEAIRRKQSSANLAKIQAKLAYYQSPEWKAEQDKAMAAARERLADSPERRAANRKEYLEQVRREERWREEDDLDAVQVERFAEKLRDKRRKEREGNDGR